MVSHEKVRLVLQVATICVGVSLMYTGAEQLPFETRHGYNHQMCDICDCTPVIDYQFIDCSNRQLQDLPAVPVNTAELNFEHNQIRTQIELPSTVLHLYGRYNQLTDIYGMFKKTSKISIVDLRGNRITSIPTGTFQSCHSMTHLYLSDNPIKHFNADSFIGLNSLNTLHMGRMNREIIEADLFREIRNTLQTLKLLDWYTLTDIKAGAFAFSLQHLSISSLSMTDFPGDIFASLKGDIQIDYLSLSGYRDVTTDISARAFTGVRQVRELKLTDHSFTYLPEDLLANISIIFVAYLESNQLEDLPVGFLRHSPQLEILSLFNNNLKYISTDILMGLHGLKNLYLFQNLITEVPPLTFYKTSLKELCIFNNKISSVRRSSFDTVNNTLETIYMYYNDITTIDDYAFDRLANNSKVYLSNSHLSKWSHYPDNVNVIVVGDYADITLSAYSKLDTGMGRFGFQCKDYQCVPCKPGTYGDQVSYTCIKCPAGGYFQEQSGQVSKTPSGIGCELCTNGTFVSPNKAPGRSPADCEVCPLGTNKTKFAGFYACPCLDGYYRKARFGPCKRCPEKGIDCTNEYQKLKPGFWWTWNWTFTTIDQDQEVPKNLSNKYKAFVSNLLIHNRSYEQFDHRSTTFDEPLPMPFPCLRGSDSCPVSNGIDESCGRGYEGWLCSRCSDGFYSWFEYCVECPPAWHLVLETLGVILLLVIVTVVTRRDIRNRDNTGRTLLDVLVARFKIVLGYYQIAGAIFTSLHNIHWPQGVSNLASVFRAFELDIFKIIAKPRCLAKDLELNIYREFVFGAIVCAVVLTLPCVIYSCIWMYIHLKLSKYRRISNDIDSNAKSCLKNWRSKCYLFVILLLFISYPSLCNVILSLLPVTCQKFCADETKKFCTHRARSDFSIDCDTQKHMNYVMSAYFALIYIVGFPLAVYIVILKNAPRMLKAHEEDDNESNCTEIYFIEDDGEDNNNRREAHLEEKCNNAVEDQGANSEVSEETPTRKLKAQEEDDNESNCTEISLIEDDGEVNNNSGGTWLEGLMCNNVVEDQETKSVESEETPTILEDGDNTGMNNHTFQYPLYIRFLCESYKPEYWYWEIIELSRKVLQTFLLFLFGSEDPVYLGASIALSIVFITSHAHCKPMKDSFEHRLQMTSLVAIVLNLLCAEVLLVPVKDSSGYRQVAMAVFIITLNLSVVLVAVGNSMLILWRIVKQHGLCSFRNILTLLGKIVSSLSLVSRTRPNDNNSAAV